MGTEGRIGGEEEEEGDRRTAGDCASRAAFSPGNIVRVIPACDCGACEDEFRRAAEAWGEGVAQYRL